MSQTLLIYTLGGGWGHLNRSLALARAAAKTYTIKIISNSPYLSYGDTKNYEISSIPAQASFAQTKNQVREIIQHTAFDRLIVDTFPRGLGGELQDLLTNISQPKILVNRYLNPTYIERYQLEEFVEFNYELILNPGENTNLAFSHLSQTHRTAPWLIRNSHELANLTTACNILKLTTAQVQQPLIIVLASGYETELVNYGIIAATLARRGHTVRCLSAKCPPNCPPEIWCCHYPALECLWLADLVIGSGGYNTVAECTQLKLPLIAIPHHRLYDCQKTRIESQNLGNCWLADHKSIAIKLTEQLLPDTKSQPLQPITFINGALQAIKIIEQFS